MDTIPPEIKVRCAHTGMIPVDALRPHPKNRNQHSEAQVLRLAKLLAYQGIRAPIVVSKLSGFMVKGHGTLLAIVQNGWRFAPVVQQDFDDEAQEYAFLQSDNAIASWADLDLAGINVDLGDLGPDFDVELLGIRDFKIDVSDLPPLPTGGKPPLQQVTFTLTEDQVNILERALECAKDLGDYGDTGNENGNGNALGRVCELFLLREGSK